MPIQTSGTRPPLFLVHGTAGDMHPHTIFSIFTGVLGPDRPLYAIHANGMDGRDPVIDNMEDMVEAYVAQIGGARPTGSLHIGGFCGGGVAAIEVARVLEKNGRDVGPVILVDPPNMPPGLNERNRAVDYRDPLIAKSLYRSASERLSNRASSFCKNSPFDPRDAQQLHAATLASIGSIVALHRHIPQPFPGSTQVVLSAPQAPGFFARESPWGWLLPGPRTAHVVPWDHREIFQSGAEHIARVVGFLIEQPTH